MKPPYSERGSIPCTGIGRREEESGSVQMLVTTISLKKKAQLLRRPHNESGDTCNFIPPHLLCHSHVTAPNISSTFFERSQGPPGMKGEAGKERTRERRKEKERDGNALKKNGEKSDARISSNPCANNGTASKVPL